MHPDPGKEGHPDGTWLSSHSPQLKTCNANCRRDASQVPEMPMRDGLRSDLPYLYPGKAKYQHFSGNISNELMLQ
jgi:hypothetical protein